MNKRLLRAPGGPFSESRENSPSDLDYSGPKKRGRRKKIHFCLHDPDISARLLVDISPHFSLSLLEVSRPEAQERVLLGPSTPPKDHVAAPSPSPPCPVGMTALHTASGWTGLNKTHQPRPPGATAAVYQAQAKSCCQGWSELWVQASWEMESCNRHKLSFIWYWESALAESSHREETSLIGTCYVPGALQWAWFKWPYMYGFIFDNKLTRKILSSPFVEEETEVQRSWLVCQWTR